MLDEQKAGTLRSGSTGKKLTSRRQAIAIGLSQARAEGDKVPTAPAWKRNQGPCQPLGHAPR